MGGTKSFDVHGALIDKQYRTIREVDGIKILEHIGNSQNTPNLSKSPNSVYAKFDEKYKTVNQITVYRSDRTKLKDIDIGHNHGKYKKTDIHVHDVVNGVRDKVGRPPTKEEAYKLKKLMALGRVKP